MTHKVKQSLQSIKEIRRASMLPASMHPVPLVIGATAITLISFLLGLIAGSVPLSLYDVVRVLLGPADGTGDEMIRMILFYYRLPRLLLVFLVGAVLAVSGALMQGIFQNPLAEPYTLGVAGGAALGAVFFLILTRSFHIWIPWALTSGAMAGGVLVLLFILFSAFYRSGESKSTLILWGVMMSSYTSALLTLALTFSGEALREAFTWLMGSAANRTYTDLVPVLLGFSLSAPLWVGRASVLDALSLGDPYAHSVGVRPERVRLSIGFAASLMAAGAVASVGVVGFVGLIVPHLARHLVGWGHRRLLPFAFWLGGIFLLWADLLARTVLAPRELPLGVVTALVGVPVFFILIKRERTRLNM